jgi:hypothetical protein
MFVIDATDIDAHHTELSLREKRGVQRLNGPTKGGMNTKLVAGTDDDGPPLSFFRTAG